MKRREVREAARQSVHALIQVQWDSFPECDLAAGIDYDEMDEDDLDTFHDEIDRIQRRIWP